MGEAIFAVPANGQCLSENMLPATILQLGIMTEFERGTLYSNLCIVVSNGDHGMLTSWP